MDKITLKGKAADNFVRAAIAASEPPVALQRLVSTRYQFKTDFENHNISAVTFDRMRSPFYEGEKWAVRRNSSCLNKEGEWEFEPMPSSRDDDFYARCRFDSLDAALAAVESANAEAQRPPRKRALSGKETMENPETSSAERGGGSLERMVSWRPASETPTFSRRCTAVIVARRGEDGKIYVFGAVWLNKYELYNEISDQEEEWTGFASDYKHPDFDDYYQMLHGVEWWAAMPLAPANDQALPRGGAKETHE